MNPKDALSLVDSAIASRQAELDMLAVARSVLASTYQPDLTALADAQAEADALRTEKAGLAEQLQTISESAPQAVSVEQ